MSQPMDASVCPLCGGPNRCALASSPPKKEPCWCTEVEFPKELLERVEQRDPARDYAGFVHQVGGFVPIQVPPEVEVRHPAHIERGYPGVILQPRPWQGFDPPAYP